jgi:tetratricopeptide (TPR) repeat protein
MKIALNMIMKNEVSVLPRVLKSVLPIIDSYYILDTGSTDDSVKLVKDFFDSHGIHGEIHVNTECVEIIEGEPCFIYDKARNEALKLLKGKADFGFFIDCDEELTVSENFSREILKQTLSRYDLASITMISNIDYSRRCFFRVDKPFKWVGKIHEVLVCDDSINHVHLDFISAIVHKDETDNDTEKYKKHTLVLKKQVEETNSPRDVFYLANSYRDSGQWEKAIEYYRKRVDMLDGFYEERYTFLIFSFTIDQYAYDRIIWLF